MMRQVLLTLFALIAVTAAVGAAEPGPGGWVRGMNVETRLLAGHRAVPDGTLQPIAGLEIKLADGWKTYWRHPGDAGGIPPSFDWSGSENLAGTRVLFPAPERLADSSGENIGYKKGVVLPIEITPKDPARPVVLRLAIEYGICREICVPAEAKLSARIEPSTTPQLPPPIAAALSRVPRDGASRRPTDPVLKGAKAELSGKAARLIFDVAGDETGADLFVEAPDAIMLPMTRKVASPAPGIMRYVIEVASADDARALGGKTLILTMTSAKGSAEVRWLVK